MAEGVMIGLKDILSTNVEDLPGEVWEEVPGYKGKYLISQYSRVKSIIKRKPLILNRSLSSGRHKVVLIGKYGRLVSEPTGRLTAKVFMRAPKENEILIHKDGNCINDQVDNLQWALRKNFPGDRIKRKNEGTKNGMAILQPGQVKEIRLQRSKGKTYCHLAKEYNVSKGCIQMIVENRTWKNV